MFQALRHMCYANQAPVVQRVLSTRNHAPRDWSMHATMAHTRTRTIRKADWCNAARSLGRAPVAQYRRSPRTRSFVRVCAVTHEALIVWMAPLAPDLCFLDDTAYMRADVCVQSSALDTSCAVRVLICTPHNTRITNLAL